LVRKTENSNGTHAGISKADASYDRRLGLIRVG
jgi:hypothetical protein